MRRFKKTNAFPVYAKCFHETVYDKWSLNKSVRQTENGLGLRLNNWPQKFKTGYDMYHIYEVGISAALIPVQGVASK